MRHALSSRVLCSAVVLAALWVPAGMSEKVSKKNRPVKIWEPVGFDAATGRIGNSCFFFVADLTGGGFFSGLERLENAQGFELRKGTELIEFYPDQIAIDIEGRAYECQSRMASAAPPLNKWNFMKLLWFKAVWEKDLQLQPAEKLRYETIEPIWWLEEGRGSFMYHLTMQTKGVALSDNLMITVLSDEGKEVVRMTGNVASGYRSLPSLLFADQPARESKDNRK
jgi:hypothetical protein